MVGAVVLDAVGKVVFVAVGDTVGKMVGALLGGKVGGEVGGEVGGNDGEDVGQERLKATKFTFAAKPIGPKASVRNESSK